MKRRAPKAKRQDYATLLRFCDEIRAERDRLHAENGARIKQLLDWEDSYNALKQELESTRERALEAESAVIASHDLYAMNLERQIFASQIEGFLAMLDCMAKALERANAGVAAAHRRSAEVTWSYTRENERLRLLIEELRHGLSCDEALLAKQREELIKLRSQPKPWWAKSFRELLS